MKNKSKKKKLLFYNYQTKVDDNQKASVISHQTRASVELVCSHFSYVKTRHQFVSLTLGKSDSVVVTDTGFGARPPGFTFECYPVLVSEFEQVT